MGLVTLSLNQRLENSSSATAQPANIPAQPASPQSPITSVSRTQTTLAQLAISQTPFRPFSVSGRSPPAKRFTAASALAARPGLFLASMLRSPTYSRSPRW